MHDSRDAELLLHQRSTSNIQILPEIGYFGDFIGRERQLLEIEERLKAHQLVTLVGPGGMGKTRSALQILKRNRGDAAKAFVSFELVRENSESAVLEALASGLKLSPGDAGDLRAKLVKRLGDSSILLVLDNCETARSSIAPVVRYLLSQCLDLRILATSQHQLGLTGLEAVYSLPPLTVPVDCPGSLDTLEYLESFKLFVTRAQMVAASWFPEENSVSSLRQLLILTDGIPLAIEIIAAWAPIMSLSQICEELTQTPLGPVTELDEFSSVVSERHRSMLRCLEWSLRHLSINSPKDAEGFMRLGVFVGQFTEDAVEKVCEVEAPRELLAHLVKTSLVQPCHGTDPRRYSMLRLTRAFAQDKARGNGIEQRLVARHMDYFNDLASPLNSNGEWEPVRLAFLEYEWPDFIAAADAAPRIGNLSAVWQISRALSPFLMQYGLWLERERLNRAAVDAASRSGARAALERALIDVGIVLEAQGRWPEAVHQYKLSLVSANKHKRPNPVHQAMALQHLGAVLVRMGDSAGAERARRRLSEITKLLDRPKAKALSLDEEGKMFEARGDLEHAETNYREALIIRDSISDIEGIARSRMNLGILFTLRGVWGEAENELRKSLAYWVTHNVDREQSITLHLLADLFRRQGRYTEAWDYCDQSLKCRGNDPKGKAVTLLLLARIRRIQRDFASALIASEQSREICRSLGDIEGESIALDDIGTTYASQYQWDEALKFFGESLRLKESKNRIDIVGLGITFDRIAQIHARRGNWGQAQTTYTDSLRFSQDAGDKVTAAVTMTNLAMMHAAQGQKKEALIKLNDVITSLKSVQTGKSILVEARKLSSDLDRKMQEGTPWLHWLDAAFRYQQVSIRKRFDHERKDEQWEKITVGYETLVREFIGSGRSMEAGLALNELAAAYRHMGDFERSKKAVQQALDIFSEIPLPLGMAASWHKLGDLFAKQHQWPDAEKAFVESIKIKLECFDDDGEAISQDALASLFIRTGRFADAERAANRSWEIFAERGSTWQKWHPLIRILWLKVEQNKLPEAQVVAMRLAEAVRGNYELEVASDELCVMAKAGDWEGVKIRLARAGIIAPVQIPTPSPAEGNTHEVQVSKWPCILVVATEWDSKHGGVSTFNRDLCGALAATGAHVICYVPEASAAEKQCAREVGVAIVEATKMPGIQDTQLLACPPQLPAGIVPDVVIGHDRITGPASLALVRHHYSNSKRVLFIHTSPEEIEGHKEPRNDSDRVARAAERKTEQLSLAEGCDLVVAVGPHLAAEFGTDLHGAGNCAPVMEFTPGLPNIGVAAESPPPSIRCLVLGRVEDYMLKGLDLAAKSFGRVCAGWKRAGGKPKLVVRGAPPGTGDALKERLLSDSKPNDFCVEFVIRDFSPEATEIQKDLREASLVLMPSRKEGFGLVGLEAIACGVPTLVSEQSGLAKMLKSHELAEAYILPAAKDTVTKWAERIEFLLLNRDDAFVSAAVLRDQLANKLDWKRSADQFIQKLNLSRMSWR